MDTLGPIFALGSTSAVSSMKHGSTMVGPDLCRSARDFALIVGERCRRSIGLVSLYEPRTSALAGTAELRERHKVGEDREQDRQPPRARRLPFTCAAVRHKIQHRPPYPADLICLQ